MTIAVKICGLNSETAIDAVNNAKADYAGFVYFERSPRHVAPERAAQLKALLSPNIKSVSVLVDPDDALLKKIVSILKPDFFQLHGKETPERVSAIKKQFPKIKIIKAISVSTSDDIAQAARYVNSADMLMFDAFPSPSGRGWREAPGEGGAAGDALTPTPLPKGEGTYLPGGNALSFDWALLKGRKFPLPWMLSGGLTAENVGAAIRISGAKTVDVSSGVETKPGVKDPALIEVFVKTAKA